MTRITHLIALLFGVPVYLASLPWVGAVKLDEWATRRMLAKRTRIAQEPRS